MSEDKKKLALKAIIATRDIIREHKWCRKHYAKDRNGIDCSHMAPQAVQFSIHGALHKALSVRRSYAALAKIDPNKHAVLKICEHVMNRGVWGGKHHSIWEFNRDKDTTYKDVEDSLQNIIDNFDELYDKATRK